MHGGYVMGLVAIVLTVHGHVVMYYTYSVDSTIVVMYIRTWCLAASVDSGYI